MRKLTATVLTLVMLFAAGLAEAQTIGHVNFEEILTAMPQAQTVQSEITTLTTELQQQYDAYLTEYQTKLNDFQQNGSTWSPTKQEAMANDITSLEQRIQEFQVTSQQKIQQAQADKMEPLIKSAQEAIQSVGQEKGITYIMESTTMYYMGPEAVDLTAAVKAKLGI